MVRTPREKRILRSFFVARTLFSSAGTGGWRRVRGRPNLGQAGSQKLLVLVESSFAKRSGIKLPKGIFIGRECMQKRGHCYKGTALALGTWTLRTHSLDAGTAGRGPRDSTGPSMRTCVRASNGSRDSCSCRSVNSAASRVLCRSGPWTGARSTSIVVSRDLRTPASSPEQILTRLCADSTRLDYIFAQSLL